MAGNRQLCMPYQHYVPAMQEFSINDGKLLSLSQVKFVYVTAPKAQVFPWRFAGLSK